jgi:hypothetical protein
VNSRHVRLAYQPPASGTFLSEQTSQQQSANSTFLLEQISTSHQPPARRTGCRLAGQVARVGEAMSCCRAGGAAGTGPAPRFRGGSATHGRFLPARQRAETLCRLCLPQRRGGTATSPPRRSYLRAGAAARVRGFWSSCRLSSVVGPAGGEADDGPSRSDPIQGGGGVRVGGLSLRPTLVGWAWLDSTSMYAMDTWNFFFFYIFSPSILRKYMVPIFLQNYTSSAVGDGDGGTDLPSCPRR